MARTLQPKLLEWLFRVLKAVSLNTYYENQSNAKSYEKPVLVYQDVCIVLMKYDKLNPRTRVYVNEQGGQDLLLQLHGTVDAVSINAWIPKEYPRKSPVMYIVPPQDKVIQPNNHLDASGKYYHPTLSSWAETYGKDEDNVGRKASEHRFLKIMGEFVKTINSAYVFKAPIHSAPPRPPRPLSISAESTENKSTTPTIPARPAKPESRPASAPPLPAKPSRPSISNLAQSTSNLSIMDEETTASLDPHRERALRDVRSSLDDMDRSVKEELESESVDKYRKLASSVSFLRERTLAESEDALKQDHLKLASYFNTIETKLHEGRQLLTQIDQMPELDLDTDVLAETVAYNQLLKLVCENCAINDVLDSLQEAFENGAIPLQALMKHTRSLAREQFMIRAHLDKCISACGLD